MKKLLLLAVCFGTIAVIISGCGNKEATSIVRVLNERKAALSRSEHIPGNANTLSIAEYTAALKTIDISGCSQKFDLAWKNYIQVLDSKKGLGVLSGASGIREAENQLEAAAIDAGVKFDFSSNQ